MALDKVAYLPFAYLVDQVCIAIIYYLFIIYIHSKVYFVWFQITRAQYN